MKYLCVCEGGNVRSVTLAYALKDFFNAEALATGTDYPNNPDTLKMLCGWADKIVVVSPRVLHKMPFGFDDKIILAKIGDDRWGSPWHPELMDMCLGIAKDLTTKHG